MPEKSGVKMLSKKEGENIKINFSMIGRAHLLLNNCCLLPVAFCMQDWISLHCFHSLPHVTVTFSISGPNPCLWLRIYSVQPNA